MIRGIGARQWWGWPCGAPAAYRCARSSCGWPSAGQEQSGAVGEVARLAQEQLVRTSAGTSCSGGPMASGWSRHASSSAGHICPPWVRLSWYACRAGSCERGEPLARRQETSRGRSLRHTGSAVASHHSSSSVPSATFGGCCAGRGRRPASRTDSRHAQSRPRCFAPHMGTA